MTNMFAWNGAAEGLGAGWQQALKTMQGNRDAKAKEATAQSKAASDAADMDYKKAQTDKIRSEMPFADPLAGKLLPPQGDTHGSDEPPPLGSVAGGVLPSTPGVGDMTPKDRSTFALQEMLHKAGLGKQTIADKGSAKDDDVIKNVTLELSNLKKAWEVGDRQKLFEPTAGNLAAWANNASGFSKTPMGGNMFPGGREYLTAANDAMLRIAKIVAGGRPNEMIQKELLAQIPPPGLKRKEAINRFNALLQSALSQSQGLVNTRKLKDPVGGANFEKQLNDLFGQYRIMEEGSGVRTNEVPPPAGGIDIKKYLK